MSDKPNLSAAQCANGHLALPGHPICQTCGADRTGTVDLESETGKIITWTTSYATPPGVREPNTLAIVEFEVHDESVRVLGGTTTDEVTIGDQVVPTHVKELRDPEEGIREPLSQEWGGYRFAPVE